MEQEILVPPRDFLHILSISQPEDRPQLIDLRSPKEYQEGHLPYSINSPILNNEERHLVGTIYKQQGSEAAIDLGHSLVGPSKEERIQGWLSLKDPLFVACWRGGLRSRIASQWIRERGRKVYRIEGGYKALRQELLSVLSHPPQLLILAGWTGSGKTQLLTSLQVPKVDIEALAHHRGSALGEILNPSGYPENQNSQSSFENALAMALWNEHLTYLLEDESTRIGHLNLPATLKTKMKISPVVFVEATEDERSQQLYQDYVLAPLIAGVSIPALKNHYISRINYMQRRLGGLKTKELCSEIEKAFQEELSFEAHRTWIYRLLTEHYDRAYQYSFEQLDRPILFRGSLEACRDFIQKELSPWRIAQNDQSPTNHPLEHP